MRARLKVNLLCWKRKLLDGTKENRLIKARLVRNRQRIKALETEVARLKQRMMWRSWARKFNKVGRGQKWLNS